MLIVPIQASVNDYLLNTGTLRSLNQSMSSLSRSLQKIKQQWATSQQLQVFGKLSLAKLHYGKLTTWLLPQVVEFISRHSLIVRQVESLNSAFVAPFFYLALLTNVPISISLHSMLLVLYGRLHFAQKMVAVNMLALQTVITLVSLVLIGRINNALYASSAPLFTVQSFLLGRQHLRQKIKLLAYYELIVSRRGGLKLGYTVGSVANISSHSLFKVSYNAYIF